MRHRFEAQHYVAALERALVSSWVALREGSAGGVGLLTTNDTKAAMCKVTQEQLEFDALHFAENFVSLSLGERDARALLMSQLRTYSIIVEPAKNVFGKPRCTFSGKMGGQQDDTAIALQLAALGSKWFNTREKYTKWR